MSISSKVGSLILAIIFIIMITVFPDISSYGVSRGLIISSNVVIPSLFPFMFCVLMLIKSDLNFNNKFINDAIYKVFGQKSNMFFIFVLSMIGGYPVGAKLINELYNKKIIDDKIADIMLTYCVNAGPAFVISVVGGVFNSKKIGFILLISHVTASIILALICNKRLKKLKQKNLNTIKISKNFSEIFVESVADTSSSIISICSFVILFSTINSYLDYFFLKMPIIKYISFFTEVTSAIVKCNNIYFASFLLGFSGLSIWCQIFSLSGKRKINFLNFIISRILHGTISTILTKIIVSIFKIKISTFSNGLYPKKELLYSNITLFCSLLIMLLVLLTFIYSKNNSRKIINDVV